MDKNHIEKLGNIIKKNSWVKYYCECGAEIDGWIDFEREIYPVVELFEFVFCSNYFTSGHGNGNFGDAHINRDSFSPKLLRIAKLWEKYFNTSNPAFISLKEPYASTRYGILKKKVMQELRRELGEFIEAFELYLLEFVYKKTEVKTLKQIKELGITTVISFNYTLTEEIYGVSKEDVHHIHGMIRNNLSAGRNNMVMGLNEQADSNMDFIYFVKYFQRIQKAAGVRYKELIQKKTTDSMVTHTEFILYIYGHSLDETDEDILKYVIGDKDSNDRIKLKPKHVIIFYYDDVDYEQKVINLIKLYGRSIVEEYMEKGLFEFRQTTNETEG